MLLGKKIHAKKALLNIIMVLIVVPLIWVLISFVDRLRFRIIATYAYMFLALFFLRVDSFLGISFGILFVLPLVFVLVFLLNFASFHNLVFEMLLFLIFSGYIR